ncbi:MAG TPA: D-alanyl-D-alanine carboxypeptidase/D-alanyl-D-alanine-endopeptidase, partial [Beutenbergiaceae bacterium]|nr:D-alanyl-D-alanine carboxypeptidase/D-alanyl-D-alanine-endopeptidase [Beutenbergiaceae bacterium]
GYLTLDALDVAPGFLTVSHPWPDPSPFPSPTLNEIQPHPAASLDENAPIPTQEAVEELVEDFASNPYVGEDPGLIVTDALTGEELASVNADEAVTPASTTKLVTGVAALAGLEPTYRITTPVVHGAQDDPQAVTIIGQGDVTLSPTKGDEDAVIGHGGVKDLAKQAAKELRARDVTTITDVVVDESMWEGPDMAPRWDDRDLAEGWIIPQSPLALDLGRIEGQLTRTSQPAQDVGEAFVSVLEDEGIEVTGEVRSGQAAEDAAELGSVESAALVDLVEYMLVYSDNVLAESLGRVVATHTNHPGSFEGAQQAIEEQLEKLEVSTVGLRLVDASGLSSKNKISPRTLAESLDVISHDHPELLGVVRGMPIAGLEGTLQGRMGDSAAAGVVRGKTGSLRNVATIAGQVHTRDGRLLHVAIMTRKWEGSLNQAREAIDDVLLGLAECGCTPSAAD